MSNACVFTRSEAIRAPLLVLYIDCGGMGIRDGPQGPFVTARLFRSVGGPATSCRSGQPSPCNRSRGEEMEARSLLECEGTVVVHRDDSVSCTDDRCPHDLPRGTWFSLHSSFVRCSTALGGDGCLYCQFDAAVPAGTRRQRDV